MSEAGYQIGGTVLSAHVKTSPNLSKDHEEMYENVHMRESLVAGLAAYFSALIFSLMNIYYRPTSEVLQVWFQKTAIKRVTGIFQFPGAYNEYKINEKVRDSVRNTKMRHRHKVSKCS